MYGQMMYGQAMYGVTETAPDFLFTYPETDLIIIVHNYNSEILGR